MLPSKRRKCPAGCCPQTSCQHPGGCWFVILWVSRGSNTVLLCLATNSGQQFKSRKRGVERVGGEGGNVRKLVCLRQFNLPSGKQS